MAYLGLDMVDKEAFVLCTLVMKLEGETAFVEEGGIPVLGEIIEVQAHRKKDIVASILLQFYEDSLPFRIGAQVNTIKPLISLISPQESQLQEYSVTAILDLSLCHENKELIMVSGAIRLLVKELKTGTVTTKENSTCALLRLSQVEENNTAIGWSGAIPLLVYLIGNGSFPRKKDASMALYAVCSVKENKIRPIQVGIMKPWPGGINGIFWVRHG
ncbi:hypothetical protein NE237_029899 [Protea cynaroides]|uniref:Uncharacterized protein n=1 Tax=Protea cynaroides TaxID=273540 RepID=A0A9Q0GW58_9MAGN|nr:hypothetical protein NE237_029899 [Protea cynaroides]